MAAERLERESRMSSAAREAGLRRHTARGTIINAAFQIGLAGLNLAQRLIVVAFLTAEEFGSWGVLITTLFFVLFIKDIGIGDKFIQQSETNQEHAFQKAFTIDLLLGALATAIAMIVIPLFALLYGEPQLIVPGMVVSLAILGNSLQSPLWVYYRRMEFVRQRTLQAITPVVTFVVTIALGIAGLGYWCLVIGGVVGSFAGGLTALKVSPYPLALRFERGTARDYANFSWPLIVASGTGVLTAQVTVFLTTRLRGLAQTGAVALAANFVAFTDGVDAIVTQTLYPAICAVRERKDLMYEAFVKSNRLALMWGLPFGFGLALFAPDLVHFVLGDRWEPAIVVIQAFGVVAAIDQVGFNWAVFMRALDRTRPLAVLAILNLAAFAAINVPLLVAFGLPGFAAGSLAVQVVVLAGRTYYLKSLFDRFRILPHALRSMAPVAPAVLAVLAVRAIEGDERTAVVALGEMIAFAVLVIGLTVLAERRLLREIIGYVRAKNSAATASAVPLG